MKQFFALLLTTLPVAAQPTTIQPGPVIITPQAGMSSNAVYQMIINYNVGSTGGVSAAVATNIAQAISATNSTTGNAGTSDTADVSLALADGVGMQYGSGQIFADASTGSLMDASGSLSVDVASRTLDINGNAIIDWGVGSLFNPTTFQTTMDWAAGTLYDIDTSSVSLDFRARQIWSGGSARGGWNNGGYYGTFVGNGAGLTNLPAGSGTVTATGGSLTVNAFVLGAGGTDTKVSSSITSDGSAKMTLGTVDLGNTTDTTLSRSSAGDVSVEGNLLYRASGTDVPVADGGSGRSTATAYALIAGGTTSSGAHQSLGAGATTEMLVGAGGAALPVWTTATGSGAPVRAVSPALTGTPTAPTQSPGNNTTAIATTAFVTAAVTGAGGDAFPWVDNGAGVYTNAAGQFITLGTYPNSIFGVGTYDYMVGAGNYWNSLLGINFGTDGNYFIHADGTFNLGVGTIGAVTYGDMSVMNFYTGVTNAPLLKTGSDSKLAAASVTDVTGLFTGGSTYLKADGTTGTGGAGTTYSNLTEGASSLTSSYTSNIYTGRLFLTNSANGATSNFTVITGDKFAQTNGANRVVITNGTITASSDIASVGIQSASGSSTFKVGNNALYRWQFYNEDLILNGSEGNGGIGSSSLAAFSPKFVYIRETGYFGTTVTAGTGFIGNLYTATNLPLTALVSPTNTWGSSVVDFSKPAASTNMSGAITFTGLANIVATNENTWVRHVVNTSGGDLAVTKAAGWRGYSPVYITNNSAADIYVFLQNGFSTNMSVVHHPN